MSHFVAYTIPGSAAKLKAKEEFKSWPQQIDFSEYISGTFFSAKPGTLLIEETFDLPLHPGTEPVNETVAEWGEKANWVPASWAEYIEIGKEGESKQEARFKIEAKQSISFTVFAGGPYWRVRIINGEEESKELRAFARAFERGKV